MRANSGDDAPMVSVIIPAFNAAKTIEHTVQSVLAQTYPYFEILVIDDGSFDETGSVVKKLVAIDDRIRLLTQENRGVAAARNFGIECAKGTYIAPLDADDLWFPEKLEKQVAVMRRAPPAVGLVYSWSVRIIDNHPPRHFGKGWEQEGPVFLPLLLGNFLSNASTPLISRKCFDHIGLYSTDFLKFNAQGCEDWDIYLRIAENYEFRVVPEHLTVYRRSSRNMSANWKQMGRSYNLLMEGIQKRHPDIPAYIFRWSRSSYLLYLANKAAQAQQTNDSLRLLSKAVSLDPCMLMNRLFVRMVAKNLLQKVRKPGNRPQLSRLENNQIQVNQIRRHRGNDKTVTGMFWTRLMNQRNDQLLQLQKTLKSSVIANSAKHKPGQGFKSEA